MTCFNLFYKSNFLLIVNIGIFFLIGWLTDCSCSSDEPKDYSAKRSGKGAHGALVCYVCVYDEALPIGDDNEKEPCIKPLGSPGSGFRNCHDILFGVWECVKKTTAIKYRNGTIVKRLERIPCHDFYYGPGTLHLTNDDIKEKKCQTNTTIGTDAITVVSACVCNTADWCNADDGIDTIDPNATVTIEGIDFPPDGNGNGTATEATDTGEILSTTITLITYILIITKLSNN